MALQMGRSREHDHGRGQRCIRDVGAPHQVGPSKYTGPGEQQRMTRAAEDNQSGGKEDGEKIGKIDRLNHGKDGAATAVLGGFTNENGSACISRIAAPARKAFFLVVCTISG